MDLGYLQNLEGAAWVVRRHLEIALTSVRFLRSGRQRRIARSVLLKTGQWALDCRSELPSAAEFRRQLSVDLEEVLAGAIEFRSIVRSADREHATDHARRIVLLNRSVVGLENEGRLAQYAPPRLILTSPPYPGVHVLYHRWQIQGRRETSAPFWIADVLDGNGASYYTFGDRKRQGLTPYFSEARSAFNSLARIAERQTIVVQLVAFSDAAWQLPEYLSVLLDTGFEEIKYPALANANDGRVWRGIPNRKWYTKTRRAASARREVVLFHRLASPP
jgi:hypothetical protein